MAKIHVFDMESFLPLYVFHPTDSVDFHNNGIENEIVAYDSDIEMEFLKSIEDEMNSDEPTDEEIPQWVMDKIKRGENGEKIALGYLKTIYTHVYQVSKKDSRIGYDIEVKTNNSVLGFEVKTSKGKSFEITSNELKTANTLLEQYHLFFIQVVSKKEVYGYIIQNPIKALNFNVNTLINVTDLENIYLSSSQFKIIFKDNFLLEMESNKVNLTDIANRLIDNEQLKSIV